jgi:DNA-binding MarR family transcriptional regulator
MVTEDAARGLSTLLLSLSGALVAAIHEDVVAHGFGDLRPAHGFAFVRISMGDATVNDVAAHLGVTKQAASQLVEELVAKGYVERRPHPADARARLIVLTARGWACTRAADEAAARAVRPWIDALGPRRFESLCADLGRIAPPGPIRPAW